MILHAGGQVRFIGGCVRDILLDRSVTDIDLATNLLPDAVQAILEKHHIHYFTIGKEFGTITAIVNSEQIEITTLRQDLNCDGRYAQVKFTDDWHKDAQRRDFTVNALSADIDGKIYDYFDGLNDLKQYKIRFIGNAEERIQEDYLRILRFFRFSAYFARTLDEEGLKAASKYAEKLKDISSTRIRSELNKIFTAEHGLAIIKLMDKQQILSQIIAYDSLAIEHLDRFYNLAKQFNYTMFINTGLIVFAILLRGSEMVDLSFTKQEQKILYQLVTSKITQWDYKSLKQYYCAYKQLFKEVILINLAEQQKIDYLLTSNLEKLFSLSIQALPIKGGDLLQLGVAPGRDLGKLLIVADQIWYDQEFKIAKAELLKKILEYV